MNNIFSSSKLIHWYIKEYICTYFRCNKINMLPKICISSNFFPEPLYVWWITMLVLTIHYDLVNHSYQAVFLTFFLPTVEIMNFQISHFSSFYSWIIFIHLTFCNLFIRTYQSNNFPYSMQILLLPQSTPTKNFCSILFANVETSSPNVYIFLLPLV